MGVRSRRWGDVSVCHASEQSEYDVVRQRNSTSSDPWPLRYTARSGPIFTAVMGGVLGVLLEAQLRALRGLMEGAPP
jgi:hypothetical protein